MRPRLASRSVLVAGALGFAFTGVVAVPAAAQTDTQGTVAPFVPAAAFEAGIEGTPAPRKVRVSMRRLNVRAGGRIAVVGSVRPAGAGSVARLQVRRSGRWITLDRDRTARSGRYVLRKRVNGAMSAAARVRVGRARRRLGRVNVYRVAVASWYGPGLYGNPLGCGGTLGVGTLGVAHKTLPCGTRVTIRHGGRIVRVRVIDRGPFVAGREFDLTAATARALGFGGHGPILTTR